MSDHHDNPVKPGHVAYGTGFFQINLGHVLTMIMIAGTVTHSVGDLVTTLTSKLTKLEVIGSQQGNSISELRAEIGEFKAEIGDVRQWRDRAAADDMQYRLQVTQSLDEVKAHVERLDAVIESPALVGRKPGLGRPHP